MRQLVLALALSAGLGGAAHAFPAATPSDAAPVATVQPVYYHGYGHGYYGRPHGFYGHGYYRRHSFYRHQYRHYGYRPHYYAGPRY